MMNIENVPKTKKTRAKISEQQKEGGESERMKV